MKKFVRGFAVLFVAQFLFACSKKSTTVVEQPATRDEAAERSAASAPGASDPRAASVPGAVSSGTPGSAAATSGAPAEENPLLIGLPPADRAKYEAWFKKYSLSSDPDVMDQDADGDGYSNREEFLADTNPRDAKSLPGVMDTASVKAVNEVTVPMILREVKGGKARVQRTDSNTEEELVSGGQPKGLPYKVTGVKHEVKADKHGVYTDVSNVTLENMQTKEMVTLIRDLPARSSETHAVVVGPNGEEKKVHLDETVEIPGMPGKQFKVIELRADQVLVEEVGSHRALSIPKR
jgi:hypothetical protein